MTDTTNSSSAVGASSAAAEAPALDTQPLPTPASERPFPTSYPNLRALHSCMGCGKEKCHNKLLCWTCWNKYPTPDQLDRWERLASDILQPDWVWDMWGFGDALGDAMAAWREEDEIERAYRGPNMRQIGHEQAHNHSASGNHVSHLWDARG